MLADVGRLNRLNLRQMTAILMENHFCEPLVREVVKRKWRFKRFHKLWDCYFCQLTSQTCLRVHWLTLPDSGSPLRFAEFSSLDTDLWPAKCALHWLRTSPAPGRNLGTKQLQSLEWSNVKSQEIKTFEPLQVNNSYNAKHLNRTKWLDLFYLFPCHFFLQV